MQEYNRKNVLKKIAPAPDPVVKLTSRFMFYR